MAKSKSLVEDVLQRAQHIRPGFRSWFERLPGDAQAELKTVRDSFDPVLHQKKSFARAIIEAANDRGWETGSVTAVIAWLNKKPS